MTGGAAIAGLALGFALAQVRADSRGLAQLPRFASSEAVTLYVSGTGNDSNSCTTAAAPCGTCAGAIQKLNVSSSNASRRLVRHPVNIYFDAGTFDGCHLTNFQFDEGAAPSTGAYIMLHGSRAAPTLASGPSEGWIAQGWQGSGFDGGVLYVPDAGWTVDDLVDSWVEIGDAGHFEPIVTNFADSLEIAGSFDIAPTASMRFALWEPKTVLLSTAARPAAPFDSSSVSAGVVVASGANSAASTVAMEWLRFTGNVGVWVNDARSSVGVRLSRFEGATGINLWSAQNATLWRNVGSHAAGETFLVTASDVGRLWAEKNFVHDAAAGMALGDPAPTLRYNRFADTVTAAVELAAPRSASLLWNFFDCGGSDYGISVPYATAGTGVTSGSLYLRGNQFDSCDVAASVRGPVAVGGHADGDHGTNNTVGWQLRAGAQVQLPAATTMAGTTQVDLGSAETATIAGVRGLTPKIICAAANRSCMFEGLP